MFGGIITITVSLTFFYVFVNSMLRPDLFYLRDTVSTSSQKYDFMKPHPSEPLFANGEKRFNMLFYINDKTFDNDDNPYGRFVFHQYTNMADADDIYGKTKNFNDFEIPISIC